MDFHSEHIFFLFFFKKIRAGLSQSREGSIPGRGLRIEPSLLWLSPARIRRHVPIRRLDVMPHDEFFQLCVANNIYSAVRKFLFLKECLSDSTNSALS